MNLNINAGTISYLCFEHLHVIISPVSNTLWNLQYKGTYTLYTVHSKAINKLIPVQYKTKNYCILYNNTQHPVHRTHPCTPCKSRETWCSTRLHAAHGYITRYTPKHANPSPRQGAVLKGAYMTRSLAHILTPHVQSRELN
jgi:hypothetical protein